MSEKDWEIFFSLVEKIVKAEGTWKQKAKEVLQMASAHDADVSFEEFMCWFGT